MLSMRQWQSSWGQWRSS